MVSSKSTSKTGWNELVMVGLIFYRGGQYNKRQHLETVLKKFHATDDEILKIEALQDFTKNSYYFDIWPKYNNWIYVYCMRRLQGLIKPDKITTD